MKIVLDGGELVMNIMNAQITVTWQGQPRNGLTRPVCKLHRRGSHKQHQAGCVVQCIYPSLAFGSKGLL